MSESNLISNRVGKNAVPSKILKCYSNNPLSEMVKLEQFVLQFDDLYLMPQALSSKTGAVPIVHSSRAWFIPSITKECCTFNVDDTQSESHLIVWALHQSANTSLHAWSKLPQGKHLNFSACTLTHPKASFQVLHFWFSVAR